MQQWMNLMYSSLLKTRQMLKFVPIDKGKPDKKESTPYRNWKKWLNLYILRHTALTVPTIHNYSPRSTCEPYWRATTRKVGPCTSLPWGPLALLYFVPADLTSLSGHWLLINRSRANSLIYFFTMIYLFNHWLFWLNLISVRRPTRIPLIRASTLYRLILQNFL